MHVRLALLGHALLLAGAMSASVCTVASQPRPIDPMISIERDVQVEAFNPTPTVPLKPLPTAPQLLVAERRRKLTKAQVLVFTDRNDFDDYKPFKPARHRYNRKHHRATRNGWLR